MIYLDNRKLLFDKYQPELVKLANNPFFRRELGVCHVPDNKKILKIVPNGVLTLEGGKLTWRFWCGRPVFAHRVDEILPDIVKFLSKDFGQNRPLDYLYNRFAFLDFPSGAGSGFVGNSNADFATARGAADGSSNGEGGTVYSLYAELTGGTYFITRHFYPTDTSALGAGFSIGSASLNLFVDSFIAGTGYANNYVVATTQAVTTTLENADYDQVGAASGGTFSTLSLGATVSTLNATGIGFISLTGTTKIGARADGDFNNSAPADGNNEPSISMPANAEEAERPFLRIIQATSDEVGRAYFL